MQTGGPPAPFPQEVGQIEDLYREYLCATATGNTFGVSEKNDAFLTSLTKLSTLIMDLKIHTNSRINLAADGNKSRVFKKSKRTVKMNALTRMRTAVFEKKSSRSTPHQTQKAPQIARPFTL